MWFEKDRTVFISLPGVPYEMKYIMTNHIIPELIKSHTSQVIIHRNIMTYGAPEARLAEILEGFEASLPDNIGLAYLPSQGIIKLRLTGTGANRILLEKILNEQVKKLYATIPELIFGENEELFEHVIGKLLKEKGQTVSTAESCTGGNIAHMLTSVPGSSQYFKGSIIAYHNDVKNELLGVTDLTLEKAGAVSEESVIAMAEGVRRLLRTDFSVATSGIAGPEGGSDLKPVGTLWIAVSSEKGVVTENRQFGTDRTNNIIRFSIAALNLLRKQIISK
jgi:nicotinamide-nucleotide amidase